MGPTRRPDFTTCGVSAQSDDTVSIRFRLCNYRIALKTPVCVGVLRELFRPCFAPTLEKPVEDTITLGVGPEDHPVRLGSNASECSRPRRGDQITAEDVRYWHLAGNLRRCSLVRYWVISGPDLLNVSSSAFDPKRTLPARRMSRQSDQSPSNG